MRTCRSQTRRNPRIIEALLLVNPSADVIYRNTFYAESFHLQCIFLFTLNIYSMASLLPGLRRAAPRLSREFFVCHQCIRQTRQASRKAQFSPLATIKSMRYSSTTASIPEILGRQPAKSTSPLGSLAQSIGSKTVKAAPQVARTGYFPETSSNMVAYWLLGSAASVFGIVILGGLTRLTESGYVGICSHSVLYKLLNHATV